MLLKVLNINRQGFQAYKLLKMSIAEGLVAKDYHIPAP